MATEKEVEAIRIIRRKEEYHFQKYYFCKDHNMKLNATWHFEMAEELRKLGNEMQKHFDTGYVSLTLNKKDND